MMREISLDAIDNLDRKLVQADAISTLIMLNFDSDHCLNDELNCHVLWAVSDLIKDIQQIVKDDIKPKNAVAGSNE